MNTKASSSWKITLTDVAIAMGIFAFDLTTVHHFAYKSWGESLQMGALGAGIYLGTIGLVSWAVRR